MNATAKIETTANLITNALSLEHQLDQSIALATADAEKTYGTATSILLDLIDQRQLSKVDIEFYCEQFEIYKPTANKSQKSQRKLILDFTSGFKINAEGFPVSRDTALKALAKILKENSETMAISALAGKIREFLNKGKVEAYDLKAKFKSFAEGAFNKNVTKQELHDFLVDALANLSDKVD